MFTSRLAVTVALTSAALGLTAVALALVAGGLDERSTPLVLTAVTAIGAIATGLVSALKATEAARAATRSNRTADLTASKVATLQQNVLEHCGSLCPSATCPLRTPSEELVV